MLQVSNFNKWIPNNSITIFNNNNKFYKKSKSSFRFNSNYKHNNNNKLIVKCKIMKVHIIQIVIRYYHLWTFKLISSRINNNQFKIKIFKI